MDLGAKIKKYRKENKLTQQDLGDKLFVSRSLIAKWEQGRGMPTTDVLEKLTELLGVSFNDLISEKEARTYAIETNHTIKSQKKLSIIITVFSCIMLITMSVFLILFIRNNTLDNRENNINPNEPTNTIKYTEVFCTAIVDEENLQIDNKTFPFFFNITLPLDSNIQVYTKDGQFVTPSYIKNGQKLRIYISYYDDGEDSIYRNNTENIINIENIYIIDDYIEGDYYVKGFFLSTFPYDGEVVPINDPNFGYEYDSTYSINKTTLPTWQVFPYCIFDYDFNMPFEKLITATFPNKTKDYTSPYGNIYKEQWEIPIILDSNIQTLYVYALDTSEKGFYEYGTITKEQPTITVNAKKILSRYFNQPRLQNSFEYELILNVDFSGCSYEIVEYNKYGSAIKKTEGFYLPNDMSSVFYLDYETRHVSIIYSNGTWAGGYCAGDDIIVKKLLYSGFVEYRYLSIY